MSSIQAIGSQPIALPAAPVVRKSQAAPAPVTPNTPATAATQAATTPATTPPAGTSQTTPQATTPATTPATTQASAATAAVPAQPTLTQLLEEPTSELQQQAEEGNTQAIEVLAEEKAQTYTPQGTATAAGPTPGAYTINLFA